MVTVFDKEMFTYFKQLDESEKNPYKIYNNGDFLCFEILNFRIVYFAMIDKVFIVHIRHTSMEPKNY